AKYNDDGRVDSYDMPKFYHNIDCVIIASDMDGTFNILWICFNNSSFLIVLRPYKLASHR
ncbi:unnamed protein product, partial [marine sediment metagenome]